MVTEAPSACTASTVHDLTASPLRCTVQAPQLDVSQPTCVPVRPSSIAQKMDQQQPRLDLPLFAGAVDLDRHVHTWHGLSSLSWLLDSGDYSLAWRRIPARRSAADRRRCADSLRRGGWAGAGVRYAAVTSRRGGTPRRGGATAAAGARPRGRPADAVRPPRRPAARAEAPSGAPAPGGSRGPAEGVDEISDQIDRVCSSTPSMRRRGAPSWGRRSAAAGGAPATGYQLRVIRSRRVTQCRPTRWR